MRPGMFRMKALATFALLGIIFLFGCRPAPATPQAQVASPLPISTNRPAVTPSLTASPATLLPIPTATFIPTTTPFPTATATAVPPTPSNTPLLTSPPTATLTPTATRSIYSDVALYGYVMAPDTFQVGRYDAPISIGGVMLEGATQTITAELATLVEGDILVELQGDYYPQNERQGRLVVKAIELVNFPFNPDTVLDATFRSQEAGFQFNYPAGWTVTTIESDDGRIGVRLHNAPEGSINWRPGRAYGDPTEFLATVFRDDTPSVEAYVLDRLESFKEQLGNYTPGDPLDIHVSMGIGDGHGARIYGWCCSSDFVFPFADGVIVWRMNSSREQNALLYRILETLQPVP